jgi:glutamate-1-semialdehyde 2,1-aminomutase
VLYEAPSRYNWMFQYYLRAEGLALSWVGTGRFIFSHTRGDADFADIVERFVRAATAMAADGWWWTPTGATNKTVRRAVLRELLRAARYRPRGAAAKSAVSA